MVVKNVKDVREEKEVPTFEFTAQKSAGEGEGGSDDVLPHYH